MRPPQTARAAAIGVMLLAGGLLLTACADQGAPTGPGSWFSLPFGASETDGGDSFGIYRIPYADATALTVAADAETHSPENQITMAGNEAGGFIVAAASGTIRAIVDHNGNSPGTGDGLAADGVTTQDDALEHRCRDDETVVGSCSDYNNYVWIEHPSGEWTKYAHLGTGTVTALEWAVGDWIEAGDTLGIEGDVGATSDTLPELHFEVGHPADPEEMAPFTALGGFMSPDFGVNLVPQVCDIENNEYAAETEYTAAACNHEPPVANAGGPYEVDEGSTVMLDGTGSDDGDGGGSDNLTFAWTPEGSLDDPSASQPNFAGVDDGEVAVGLTVYDQVEMLWNAAETTVTVLNVLPDVTIDESQVTFMDEGGTLDISASFSDPGVLDAPFTAQVQCYDLAGYALSVEGTVELTSEDGPITGTVTAQCDFGDTSQEGDPLSGTFAVVVSVTDKDGGTGEASFDLTVYNVDPTTVMDLSGATLINGVPTFLTSIGESVDFSAQVTDPGSDDIHFTWDWADGNMAMAAYLLDDPNADPFPSPTMDPRDVTDMQSYAWADACFYTVNLTSMDDDAGQSSASAPVVVTGNAGKTRGAGYWMTQYRGNRVALGDEVLGCYLQISNHMSAVFDEERDGTDSFDDATDVLWTNDSRGRMWHLMDRQLLTAWLNFANGAFGWDDLVDTDGDGMPDTAFSEAITHAEMVRLDAEATRQDLAAQKDILEYINSMDEDD